MSLANLITLARGKSGFGMMYSPLGRFPFHAGALRPGQGRDFRSPLPHLGLGYQGPNYSDHLASLNQSLIFLTMALCLIRGLPVIQDGRILFRAETNWPDPAALACVLALEAQGPQTSLADPVFHALTGK